jgi:two-component system, OmpR family, sensor histidine kinase BaeS
MSVRSWYGRTSLRHRLPASYAAVALVTMLALGAILLPVLAGYYTRAEDSYLEAGAERALTDLATVDWMAVANSDASTTASLEAARQTKVVALVTQLRVQVLAPNGAMLSDSGSLSGIDPGTLSTSAQGQQNTPSGRRTQTSEGPHDRGDDTQDLPSLLGKGLLGGSGSDGIPRSGRTVERTLAQDGRNVAVVRLSEAPAYGAVVLRSTSIAWALAGLAAVVLAALVGWLVSRRLTQPLLAITDASDRMAGGDLAARADVEQSDEIGRLARSFNVMAGRVEHTVSALQRFVADAAHELGTPLTALEADLDLAERRIQDKDGQRLIGRAMRQAGRLEALSLSLLQLSRLDTGEFADPPHRVDMADLVHTMADSVASRAEQAGIDFRLDLASEPVPVIGYEDKLRTAVGNLVDNALKFTPPDGTVVLGLRTEDRRVRLWVEDTGIGVPGEDMEGLFGRFHRGRNVSAYPGSGLGLAIVKATMDVHGGSVTADSTPAGSRFELTLPAA